MYLKRIIVLCLVFHCTKIYNICISHIIHEVYHTYSRNLLEKDVKDSFYRNRKKDLTTYFSSQDNLIYCYDVDELMRAIGPEH